MNKFVEKANLPHAVRHLLIGNKYSNILNEKLINLDICPIKVPNNTNVDPRMSGHCDLSVLHGGGKKLFFAPFLRNTKFYDELACLGAEITWADITQGAAYPFDAGLNIAVIGNKYIFCQGVSDSKCVRTLTNRGMSALSSRQGYARCSVCVADEESIITADKGIANAAQNGGLKVLLIEPGYIALAGFEYGFIGGATFKISDKLLAFTGKLEGHPDREKIFSFLAEREISPIFLTDEPIFDIGGAVPLTER